MDDTGDWMGDLERQRLQLEENVSSLEKSLYHWRLWEAEYDGLREEVEELKEQSTREDLLKTGREFGGTLVNEEEIKKLLGEPQGITRSRQQVVDLISRRIDYVQENVKVFEKRLTAAEEKLNALLATEQSGIVKQDSLPMTEIVEELDEEGKVVSSSTTTPNEAAPMIMDVLKKAGVELPSQTNRRIQQSSESAEPHREIEELTEDTSTPESESEIASDSAQKNVALEPSSKSEQPVVPSSQDSTGSVSNVPTRGSSTQDLTNGSSPGHEDSEDDTPPVMDVNESPEDAALRREMLQYGLDEVGAVVAELDLDDDGSEFSIDDDEEYDYMEGVTDDEDEDEYGRTTRKVVDDDYRKQMLELEKKLNAKGLQNIGPDSSSLPVEVREELEKPSAMKTGAPEKAGQKTTKKKKVAFADDLDIAPAPDSPNPPSQEKATKAPAISEVPEVPAIQETVMERIEPSISTSQAEAKPPKKVSRFKTSRNSGVPVLPETQPAPEPPKPRPSFSNTTPSSLPLFPAKPSEPKPFSQPIQDPNDTSQTSPPKSSEGNPLADNIVEREPSPGTIAPPDPDGLDEILHRQEVATEFYRMRNRKIQQTGGFVEDEDEEAEMVPAEEPTRKVSRFMAARAK